MTMYEYVVLRLAPDAMRGEVVNVGVAVFAPGKEPDVRWLAAQPKIKALGLEWDVKRTQQWLARARQLAVLGQSTQDRIAHLAMQRMCEPGYPGFFHAESREAYEREIEDINQTYVRTGSANKPERRRGPRLMTEMRQRFEKMQVLGRSVDDIQAHLVVPSVPVPSAPDLKLDFVYKNGVYRVTQTLDYRVSAAGAHQKVQEACAKSVAADLAAKAWGSDTRKFAVVHVPEAVADVADSHLDMLHAQGFDIFHANVPADMARYHDVALKGAGHSAPLQ